MSKEIDGPIAVLGCFGLIVLVPVAACLDGYVLSVLWSWFIVPIFRLGTISIPQAIGISMVVALLTHQDCQSSKKETWWGPLLALLVKPVIALLFGWLIRMWI